jgi:nucleotide-binding universal stress UspA family protein
MGTGWMDEIRAWLNNGVERQARLLKLGQGSLHAEAQRLARIAGAEVAPVVLQGHPVDTLCAQAEAVDASLVVVGALGSNPLHHLLIGTTAERLLRKIGVPLLVVRHPPRQNLQRVLVPLDFSP